jgi:hypothetical protein
LNTVEKGSQKIYGSGANGPDAVGGLNQQVVVDSKLYSTMLHTGQRDSADPSIQ